MRLSASTSSGGWRTGSGSESNSRRVASSLGATAYGSGSGSGASSRFDTVDNSLLSHRSASTVGSSRFASDGTEGLLARQEWRVARTRKASRQLEKVIGWQPPPPERRKSPPKRSAPAAGGKEASSNLVGPVAVSSSQLLKGGPIPPARDVAKRGPPSDRSRRTRPRVDRTPSANKRPLEGAADRESKKARVETRPSTRKRSFEGAVTSKKRLRIDEQTRSPTQQPTGMPTAVPTGWMVERVATTIVKPSPDWKLGITLETVTGSGKIEIVSAAAGSPTEAAGLRAGDVVVEIAGRPAPPTAKECTALLKEAVGECAVTVERMYRPLEGSFLGKYECTGCKCCTVEIKEHLFLASCGFYCAYYKCGPVGGCCLSVMDCTSCEDPVLLGEPCHAMAINDNDTIIDYCCFEEKRVPLPLAVALPR